MNEIPPVSRYLLERNIPHRVFHHTQPIHSLEDAAEQRGQRPTQIVRSILFRLEEGEYAMVLVAGPQQISWKALRQFFGRSRLTMASEEEVLTVTGYRIGSVSPFGLPAPLRILLDESLLAEEELSLGSGVRGVAVILRRDDLLAALPDAEHGHFY